MSEIRQAQCLGDSFSNLVQQLAGRVQQTIPWHRRHRAEAQPATVAVHMANSPAMTWLSAKRSDSCA